MIRILTVLTIFVAVSARSCWAGAPETAKTSETYLAAYERLDLGTLASLYSEEAVFTDPTSYDQPGIAEPFTFKGKAQVLAGLKSFQTQYGLSRLKYEVTQQFASPNQVVFIGSVTSVVKGPKGERAARYPVVTIITVTGGLVSEHRDYVDYPGGKPVKVPE